ncbi:MAG: UvrD-helicase domain-containing protein [Treponema sp.]|jgi:uncharacterized protein (TIGR00375 family)|nr:UvrD-helicase domain-containing protein [Treponema sp.]
MRVRADLHIHSHYSRATSGKLTPPYLERWARIKGIDLVGTGDCIHPLWLAELRELLEDAESGLYVLKSAARAAFDAGPGLYSPEGRLPRPGGETGDDPAGSSRPRFVLTGEISTIYKREGRTRKVHHLALLPDFKAAAAFQAVLERVGNIRSDGRPILGIDSRDLLAMLLDTDERALLIPAHIWTPWFSALGANSGFDSIDECYRDLACHIPAIETGLSSNPPMNWAVRALDRFAVISNSDAHSPDKLGREATVFDMEWSFASLGAALRSGRISETIEFFPQEGKYHYDGHRACGVFLTPEAAAGAEGRCPACGKPLTRGVMGRVRELADRPVDEGAPFVAEAGLTDKRRPYRSLIPLKEILGELLETGPASKKVDAAYSALIEKAGSEFALLLDAEAGEIETLRLGGLSGELLAEAISRMRSGTVSIKPGYDGLYGRIRVFPAGYKPRREQSGELFEGLGTEKPAPLYLREEREGEGSSPCGSLRCALLAKPPPGERVQTAASPSSLGLERLNKRAACAERGRSAEGAARTLLTAEQAAAVSGTEREAIIIAGPGTGKTAVLAARIVRLLEEGAQAASILAVSFTVKAAAELRERIAKSAGGTDNAHFDLAALTVCTFHSFCASLLREQGPAAGIPANFRIIAGAERDGLLAEIAKDPGIKKAAGPRRLGEYIESRKRFLLLPGEEKPALASLARMAAEFGPPPPDGELEAGYRLYRGRLRAEALLDFEDLVAGIVRLLAGNPAVLANCRSRWRHILVDEYQDVNFAQYALIRLLVPGSHQTGELSAGNSAELRVIGDPNQAIYAFRGSDKRFIDRFTQDYPQAACFHLRRSFRCAAPILNAAGRLTGARLEGEDAAVPLFRFAFPTEKSEAEGIARRIAALVGGTSFFAIDSKAAGSGAGSTNPGEIAVLLRSAALARPVLKALEDHGIPYEFWGDKPWWEEEPARSLIGLLRSSDLSVREKSPVAAVRAARDLAHNPSRKKNGGALDGEAPDRLTAAAAFYDDLAEFLDTLAFASEDGVPEIPREGVRIMTIHASKGLEFDHVFVPALEEGLLPFTLYEGGRTFSEALIEEEQRLLYVAMTRARRGLYLSRAETRMYGRRKLTLAPSRFLKDLEPVVPLAKDQSPKRDPQRALF